MPSDPLVSIYIPTRGRPELLRRAVESALGQDYPSLEVIVSVDGPDPATEAALDSLAKDERLVVFLRQEAGGACAARNDALQRARGELATGLDDDDVLLPGHLSNLVRTLHASGASFSCTSNVLRRADGDVVRHPWSGVVELDALLEQNVVGNQVLTRTQHLLEVGGYDRNMPAWQDYDLWVRLAARFGPGFRSDARTYLQDARHGATRISTADRIRRAHELFVAKHESLLAPRHRLSLELLAYATAHEPFPLRRLPSYVAAGYAKRALSALVSDRLPALRSPLRRLLGLRRSSRDV